MIRGIIPICIVLSFVAPVAWAADQVVHPHGIDICSQIIQEMSEGKISLQKAREISLAIGNAGNRHFGKVTCGDMWLYMAIVYIESGFRNNIINEQNCRGMFQIHAPSWAGKLGVKYADLLDLQTNANAGVGVFKYYLRLYPNLVSALSAYNSDDPRAAIRYARAVLYTRQKIKKRYTQIYRRLKHESMIASEIEGPEQK